MSKRKKKLYTFEVKGNAPFVFGKIEMDKDIWHNPLERGGYNFTTLDSKEDLWTEMRSILSELIKDNCTCRFEVRTVKIVGKKSKPLKAFVKAIEKEILGLK